MTTSALTKGRSVVCLIVAVLACSVPAACADGESWELTLRRRVGTADFPEPTDCWNTVEGSELNTRYDIPFMCRFELEEQVWSDGDKRRAIVPPRSQVVTIAREGYGDTECGGHTVADAWSNSIDGAPAPESDPYRLELDSGSVVVLSTMHGRDVGNFSNFCQELSGSWRGIAGDLEETTGSYTMINDSVQTVLRLVED